MSTKIYNGWRLGHVDVFEVQKKVTSIFKPILLETMHQTVLNETVFLYDQFIHNHKKFMKKVGHKEKEYLSLESKGTKDMWMALFRIAYKQYLQDVKDTFYQPNMEVVYLQHPGTKELFCFVYASNDITELFEKEFGEPFQYWNNSDRSDDVETEEEWDSRLSLWEEVFDLNRPPVAQGLSQKLLDTYESEPRVSYFEKNTLIPPSIEERAEHLADILVDQDSPKIDFDNGMSDLFEYLRSPERKEAHDLKSREILATLVDVSNELKENLKPYTRK